MTSETSFIEALRAMATDPAARGLTDDAAVLDLGGTRLVLTHDMIVEGVHFLESDPAGDVAWKLVAVNLSDLAGKGARPIGALLGYALGEEDWDRDFLAGLSSALAAFGLPLLGGDTVRAPHGTPRSFGMTVLGLPAGEVPARSGAAAGDMVWVSGSIGDAGGGLRVLLGEIQGSEALIERYRLPRPRLAAGEALAPLVSAMMDVSDGLLIDLDRLARASGLAASVELDTIPLSADYISALGEDRGARLAAATAGDDCELLFTAPRERSADLLALSERIGITFSRIGIMAKGEGLVLCDGEERIPLPERLGYQH